jgi:hypothetical protein
VRLAIGLAVVGTGELALSGAAGVAVVVALGWHAATLACAALCAAGAALAALAARRHLSAA